MNRFDSIPLPDREWARILEESAEDELAEQDQLRLERGLLPARLHPPRIGHADCVSSNSQRPTGLLEPGGASPLRSTDDDDPGC